ncbi:MAG: hypothetical protein LT105_14325, partial [Lentimicrobium sp.]|nr:hypothetical protein [Lentimicrobium sp.]
TVVVFFPEADAVPVFINEYSKIILSSLRSMICVSVIYVRRNLAPTPAIGGGANTELTAKGGSDVITPFHRTFATTPVISELITLIFLI